MSQLIQLRQKIKSIKTTQKITHAVRLVSMSLYAKLEKRHSPLKYYTQQLKKIFESLQAISPDWKHPILLPNDILDTKPLFIIIATSKGLCGSLNSNLFRYFEETYAEEKTKSVAFITIGKKATSFIQEKSPDNIICNYTELNSNNYASIANDLLDKIMHGKIKYSSVTTYASNLKTFFIQKPHKTTLIPFLVDEIEEKIEITEKSSPQTTDLVDETEPIWEQKPLEILDYLATCYLREFIIRLLYQSLLAEQAARFIAMDGSTNNAKKILEKLTLLYNKQRQSLITKEVSEFSSTSI
ncbi:MAG: FoF1 ATP synthase subunit gamma [bacterium]